MDAPIAIVATQGGEHLAQDIVAKLEEKSRPDEIPAGGFLTHMDEKLFSNSEKLASVLQSLRGRDVYIVADCYNSTVMRGRIWDDPSTLHERACEIRVPWSIDDHLEMAETVAAAIKQAHIHNVRNFVLPAFPYARQDKPKSIYGTTSQELRREGITARDIAQRLDKWGPGYIFTLDIHNDAIAGFFNNYDVENLYASAVLLPYLRREVDVENAFVLSPDAGRNEMASYYARKLDIPRFFMDKKRDERGRIIDHSLNGSLEDVERTLEQLRSCRVGLIVDDMVDTAGTMCGREGEKGLLTTIREKTAIEELYVVSPLSILSGKGMRRMDAQHRGGVLTKLITTDAVWHGEAFANLPWVEVRRIGGYFGEAIFNNHYNESVSKMALDV